MKLSSIKYHLLNGDRRWYGYFNCYNYRDKKWTWQSLAVVLAKEAKDNLEYATAEAFSCCTNHRIGRDELIFWANALPETVSDGKHTQVYRRHAQDVLFMGVVATGTESSMHETLHQLDLLEKGGYTPKDGIVYLIRAEMHKQVLDYISWLPDAWKLIEKQVRPFLTPELISELHNHGHIQQVDAMTSLISRLASNTGLAGKETELKALSDTQWQLLCSYAHPKKAMKSCTDLLRIGRPFPDMLHSRIKETADTNEFRPFLVEYAAAYPGRIDIKTLLQRDLALVGADYRRNWEHGLSQLHTRYKTFGADQVMPQVIARMADHPRPQSMALPAAFNVWLFGKPLHKHISTEQWHAIITAWITRYQMNDLEVVGLCMLFKKLLPSMPFPDFPAIKMM